MNEESKDCTRLPVVGFRGIDPDGGEGFVGAKWPSAFGEACIVEPLCRLTDAQALIAELRAENERLRGQARQVAPLSMIISIALEMLNDPEYQLSGLDFDYEHTLHNKIDALRSHIRTDNSETLVNALKEIERLKNSCTYIEDVNRWSFCPECGSEKIHYAEGDHKQCADCYQEWWADVNYHNAIQLNFQDRNKLKDEIKTLRTQLQAAPAERGVVVPYDLLVRVLEPVTSEQYINSKHELLALMREFARLNPAPAAQPVADNVVAEVVSAYSGDPDSRGKVCLKVLNECKLKLGDKLYLAARSPAEQPGLSVPEGFALVPIEPTPAMVNAAACAITTPDNLPPVGDGWTMSDLAFRSRYQAAIAAAPSVSDNNEKSK